ncbi:MAG TPA: hypothetical protein VMV73_06950 [Candidatus Dormibacteraeota bacterium]|nr:hypothetical protein [Candidatus Dormibacteraeota bacterium]
MGNSGLIKRVATLAFAAIALVANAARADAPAPSVYVGVEDATAHGGAATGVFSLTIASVGRPFTFDPRSLHFSWQAENANGGLTASRIPAAIRLGAWTKADLYPSYIASPDRNLNREYRAKLYFGAAPGAPGRYELTVNADTGFAHTDQGVSLVLDHSNVVEVYWPDERKSDAATADLRRRILGRTVYAFGGSLLECRGSSRAEPFSAPLRVTRVSRHVGTAYWLETGATGRAYPTSFVAIDPIEVNIDNCAPGFRFADPWQAGVSITTQAPPPSLQPDAAIVPGTSRNAVLWLLGYPDQFGAAQYFNALERWEYAWPQGVSKSVTFEHDHVAHYRPSGLKI